MRAKDAVGRYGEKVAERYLVDAGWVVLDRNWRGTRGELDVVARHGDVLVVVEVKTRRGRSSGTRRGRHPGQARRLRRLTGEWMATHAVRPASVRIDVLAVVLPKAGAAQVEHLVGVS
ncbi:YraN family protein [Oerskovia sp. M15]